MIIDIINNICTIMIENIIKKDKIIINKILIKMKIKKENIMTIIIQ